MYVLSEVDKHIDRNLGLMEMNIFDNLYEINSFSRLC